MKSLKLIWSFIALAWLCSSCASAYVHNTFKAPIYDSVYAKDISFDAGAHHVGAGVSMAPTKNLQFLTGGHVSSFEGKWGGYGEMGIGYHNKQSSNVYLGFYYTLGMGSNNGQWDVTLSSFSKSIKSSYVKNSLNGYVKYKGRHFRPYLGLRASYVNFERYVVDDRPALPRFEQLTYEPIFGFDIVLGKDFYFFCQNMVMIYEPNPYLNAPDYKVFTMRFGVGWILR